MIAESPGARDRIGYWRQSFRKWRWQRPFWAGLLTLLAGLPIAYFPYANLTMGQLTVRMATTAGSGSVIIGVLLITLGLTMWYQQLVRVFAGVAAILLALVSLVVSNFGGFLVGFLLAIIGGGLALSWAPGAAGTGETDAAGGSRPQSDDRDSAREAAIASLLADDQATNGRHRAG